MEVALFGTVQQNPPVSIPPGGRVLDLRGVHLMCCRKTANILVAWAEFSGAGKKTDERGRIS